MSRLKKGLAERQERKIIRRARVKELTGVSDATLWRWEGAGTFPPRVVLSKSGMVGWFEDEVLSWVHTRIRSIGKRPAHIAPAAPPQKTISREPGKSPGTGHVPGDR